MAQVKVQTAAPLAGPGLTAGVPPAAMASSGSLGLQSTINGTGPAPAPACPAPAVGYGDAPVSASPPGRTRSPQTAKFVVASHLIVFLKK